MLVLGRLCRTGWRVCTAHFKVRGHRHHGSPAWRRFARRGGSACVTVTPRCRGRVRQHRQSRSAAMYPGPAFLLRTC